MEKNKQTKKIIFEYIRVIVVTLVLTYGILFFFQVSSVNGISMEPTYQDGDIVIIEKVFYKQGSPEVNDLVVAIYNNGQESTHIIKRVIAVEGDKIEIIDNVLYRNGTMVDESYIYEDMLYEDISFTIPSGKVFLMGDNRNASLDSRELGYFDFEDDIIGKVIIDLSNLF